MNMIDKAITHLQRSTMSLFSPTTLDDVSAEVTARLGERAGAVFRHCFADTLASTIEMRSDATAFVVTGDIPAMWQRDSATQLTPYLHFLQDDHSLADTVAAVSRRQLANLCLDPYANAFNREANGHGHQNDHTDSSDWVWERKYEIDSLCFPIQLAYDFWRITARTDHLVDFLRAARTVIEVLRTEQNHEVRSPYRFQRLDGPASDSLARGGLGSLVQPNGLTWSGFRPSDDACVFGYNIPGNAFAATELRHIADMAHEVFQDEDLAMQAARLGEEIAAAVATHGTARTDDFGTVFCYETDGLGGALLMDDSNMPSLMSLPLMGWCDAGDATYLATRKLILSERNPYFYRGTAARGTGSPHTPEGTIWPIGLAVQALTSQDSTEKEDILEMLVRTDAGTGFMHESFHKDDPSQFTRPWFSWANAMFCELALDLAELRTYKRQPSKSQVEP